MSFLYRHQAREIRILILLLMWGGVRPGAAQQVGDTTFAPDLGTPAFQAGGGPRVVVDAAHMNFHTIDGRYGSFARVLKADGFQVKGSSNPFTASSLEGGALLLADHMPFPGAAGRLAAAFGFELNNGFAVDTASQGPLVFRRSDGSLSSHPSITVGADRQTVDSVATFTGSAFKPSPGAVTLLTLPDQVSSLMPQVAWEFGPETKSLDVGGWAQGAILEAGRGRVAVFGEAAMFSAQLAGPAEAPMGMNAPVAAQNAQFLVNLVRWLTRVS